jgi:D-alanyl-D-alanine carboxypeptidase (penicillin-binding protein 5/6)
MSTLGLAGFLALSLATAAASDPPEVSAKAWAIVDADTGALLAGKDERAALPMASTTKITTALAALRHAEPRGLLEEKVTVSAFAAKQGGSRMGLAEGDELTLLDLLYGLLLPSGNDAAVAIAEFVAERLGWRAPPGAEGAGALEAAFVVEMNRLAGELRLEKTRYVNAHGRDAKGHVSCALDLAATGREALRNARLREILGTAARDVEVANRKTGLRRTMKLENTNRLLGRNGVDAGKTGTTERAGACLVSTAARAKRRLLVVVLGCTAKEKRFEDTAALLEWAWSKGPASVGR